VPKADFDKVSIVVSLGQVIGKLSASELQDRGVLARCHVNIVQLKDDKEFSNYQSELKFLTEDNARLDAMARLIAEVSKSGNTLILVDRISAGKAIQTKLSDIFKLLGEDSEVPFVSGSMKLTERKEEYDEVKTSSNKVIVATYGVAAVGINIPRIFNLVLIEPGKSFVRVIQSIGRGIRKAEDKDHVEIWDLTSSCKFAKRHLTQRKAFYREANYPFTIEKLDY
jgi:superfamily II DNA or RNA helicase